ncbi:hypothetical protein Cgig2_002884 [Carnegiea gigantea]|uniref:Uncharacterized protein n=1 Tax=Carnegiea gigantea TaxID=171969 RepID=A0A9Q1KNY5_9CARY|nr:hypothetical protein Cgig2_002884 [Carnegiea gigantea]
MENHLANSQVKLISECMIKPENEIEQSKHPHYLLGPGDLLHLSTQYMQFGLLYTKPSTFNIHCDLLERLKHAVSHALVYYYPLAGRLATVKYEDEHACRIYRLEHAVSHALVYYYPVDGRLATVKYEDEHACRIYVDCHNGPEARFIHVSSVGGGVSVASIVSYSPLALPIVRSFFDLGEKAVTELVDRVFIGFTVNHALVDGTSFWKFTNILSEIFKSISNHNLENVVISQAPIFEPIYPYGYGPIIKLPYLDPDEFLTRFNMQLQLSERFFHFSPASLAK